MKTTSIDSRNPRCGFAMPELLVAATLLVAAMSLVAPLAVRSGRLWQDTRHYHLAVDQLANQLEYLTSLDEPSRAAAMTNLDVSPQLQAVLPRPELSAETVRDEFGTRLVLHLVWDRPGRDSPVTLVGWIDPMPATGPSADGGSP